MAKPKKDANTTLCCSFCGKSQHDVKKLIASSKALICDACVELCNEMIADPGSSPACILEEELVSSPRKMLDIPVERDAFNYVATELSTYRAGLRASPRKLLQRAVRIYARYIVKQRLKLDGQILKFQEERRKIT